MSYNAWNDRNLARPVINTEMHRNSKIDLVAVRDILERAIADTFDASKFHEIAALASRLIARRSSSFRAQYGFKLMRKTNIALCRLHECNVTEVLEDFVATMPPAYRAHLGSAHQQSFELPTRDNLDYLLVRVHSLIAILFRIVRCARQSSEMFLFYVHRHFFLETSVLHVALLADIWHMSFRLCEKAVRFYDQLRAHADYFGERQTWLQSVCGGRDRVAMPLRMGAFLGEEWAEECRRAERGTAQAGVPLQLPEQGFAGSDPLMSFGNDDAIDVLPDLSDPKRKEHLPAKAIRRNKVQIAVADNAEKKRTPAIVAGGSLKTGASMELGEVIERTPKADATVAVAVPKLEHLATVDEVRLFMKSERARLTSLKMPANRRIGSDRWKQLQVTANRMLTGGGNKAVKAFRNWWTATVIAQKF